LYKVTKLGLINEWNKSIGCNGEICISRFKLFVIPLSDISNILNVVGSF